jgi:hypothetical protein
MHGGTTTQPQDSGEGRHWDGKLPENTPSSYYPNDVILAHSREETSRRKELADFVSRSQLLLVGVLSVSSTSHLDFTTHPPYPTTAPACGDRRTSTE